MFEPKDSGSVAPARLVVEIFQVVLHKADEPNVVADLGNAHVLPREGMTQIHFPPVQTNPPATRHEHRRVVEGLGERLQAAIDAP